VIGETVDDDRLARKDKVLGIGHDGGTKTFPLSALETNPVVNDRVAGEDMVVFSSLTPRRCLFADGRWTGSGRCLDRR